MHTYSIQKKNFHIACACAFASIVLPATVKAIKFKILNPDARVASCLTIGAKKVVQVAAKNLDQLLIHLSNPEDSDITSTMNQVAALPLGNILTPSQLILMALAINNFKTPKSIIAPLPNIPLQNIVMPRPSPEALALLQSGHSSTVEAA
ncbi:hypothetical protein AB751O23_BC_00080 [Chlamydiales bacterium SCGC AB-751-O23]|jgi:hypothetical protein|nr:hypothetical protein AB751O23_BC_00080 [Chlamydiales bacterium SCGC AB-751-O23]